MILVITLFPTITLVVSTYFILIYFQNACFQIVKDFSNNLFQDQITSSKLLNSAIVFQLSSQTQKIDWQMNLANQFFGNVIQGKVIKNSQYIPAIHNIDRTYNQTENPVVLNMFKKNSIMTTTWHQVSKSFLKELDQIQLKELDETIRLESIWKSIQLNNKKENGRWMKFKDFYYGFDYDGLIYTVSINVTYKGYVPPKGFPHIGQFLMDVRCRYYQSQAMGNYSTIVFNPSIFYTDVTPLKLQPICKRRLKYESADTNSKSTKYSILCLTLDLTLIPKYFENFGKNFKLQFVLNPTYLTVVYNSEQNLKRTQVVTIKDIETQYFLDQNQAKYFLNNITQNNDFIIQNANSTDLFGFSFSYQYLFEYNRNGIDCLVIKNRVTFIDKVPKYEYQKIINPAPKFQKKQVRDTMIQYLPTIEDINKDMWLFDEMNNYDSHQQEQCQKESCFSSDTQQLFDSFKNIFKVLAFTTVRATKFGASNYSQKLQKCWFYFNQSAEKCVLYLPHLKKQALNKLNKLFMQQNINNPELCEILNKYLIFPHTYFRICIVQACQSKYSLFRSFTVQSDLIKEILFKEQDQIGLLNYSFEDNHYTQLSQFINLKNLNSNLEIFENIFIKLFLEKLLNKDLKSLEKYGINNQSEIQQPYQSQIIFQQNRIQLTKSNFQDCQQKTIQKQDQNRDSLNKPISNEQKYLKDSFNTQFVELNDKRIKQNKNLSIAQKLQQRLKVMQQSSKNQNKYSNLQLSQFNQDDSLLNPDSLIRKYTFSPIKNNFKTHKTENQEELIKIENSEQIISNNIFSENKLLDFSPNFSQFNSNNKYEFNNYNSTEIIINKNKFQISEKQNNYILESQTFQSNLISKFAKKNNLGESFSGLNFEFIDNNNNQGKIKEIACQRVQKTKQDHQNQEQKQKTQQSQINSSIMQLQNLLQESLQNQMQINKNPYLISSEFLFHQGIQAALRQFILNTNEKLSYLLSEKKHKEKNQEQKGQQVQRNKEYQTYIICITDQQLQIQNKQLFEELSILLINLQIELLVVVFNQDLSQQEYTDFKNIFYNQKPVVTFFSTEEKLLQYIYNSREHLKKYLYPMIYEHF
ncbi:hypothetical protein ABPG72_022709 [Tetrahymena utriculariae]